MQELIKKAESFISRNGEYNILPCEISAPVMASFADAVIRNELVLSKEELFLQAKEFILNEELEEIFYCIDTFAEACMEFISSLTKTQEKSNSIHC